MPNAMPARGVLTFEAEGNDSSSSRYYSRRLHWPRGASGVTIGRGYDMRYRTAAEVRADFIAAGVPARVAEQYSGGAGLHGREAEAFVDDHRDEYDELTWDQQLALFETVYDEMCQSVRWISNKQNVIDLYGSVDWEHVDQRILDVIVDLRYRGDYRDTTRQEVQEPFAENDYASFREVMRNEAYWVTQRGVPQDRFNRRRDYLPEGTGAAAGTTAAAGQAPFDLQRMSEAQLHDHLQQAWRRAQRRFGHEGDSVYDFQAQDGRVNLLGARGFRRDTMQPCVNTANTWDDTMFVVYKDAAGQKRVRTFTLSTEPNTAGGISFLKVGMHKYWLNYHKKSKPKVDLADHVTNWPGSDAQYRALNPLGGVSTFLDNDGDLQQDTGEADESDAAINVHYGGAGESPSGWSKGCQVIRTWADYRAFIELVESDHSVKGSINNELASTPSADGTRAVIYLLVEGSELRPVGLCYPAEGQRAGDLYQLNEGGEGGFFPIGANNFWHGGVHLDTDRPICAIADGRLVAYRINQAPLRAALGGESLEFSNGFALVRHELTTPKGTAIRFYSLYMHLLPLDGYTDEQKQRPPAFLLERRFFVASGGLNVRENGSGTTVLRTLAEGDELTFKDPHLVAPNGALADGWFELAEGGWVRVRPGGDNPTVRCETELGADTVDAVVVVDVPIAGGEIVGHPGPYLTRPATVHFEIFTDDVGFMDNPNADAGGRRTLVIPAGTSFMQRVAAENPRVSVNLPPGSRLRFLERKGDNRRVVCEEIVGWALRSVLGGWDDTSKRYTLDSALATLYVARPSGGATPATVAIDAPACTALRYVSRSGDYRRVAFTVPEDRRADLTGWTPRSALGDYAGSHYTLTALLASIQAQDPAGAFSFEGDAGSSERELVVDVPEQVDDPALCKDGEGKVWQEVEIAPGQRGWIAHDAAGVAVKSSHDWPRWRRMEEHGDFSDDGLCDAPELIALLDADGDREIARDEIRAALADPAVGPRLRRLAVKHPSEWSAEGGTLERLKEAPWFLSDDEIQETEAYIGELRFWEDATDAGLPAAGGVWHLHPIGFVEHLNEMLFGAPEAAEAPTQQPAREEPPPAESGEHYGGYRLQKDDKDADKRWGGEVRDEVGAYVKELQEDLVALGYWISLPDDQHGMNADGHFGTRVKAAVRLFQREHDLEETGEVDTETASLIKEKVADTSFTRPGHATASYGRFYQLPPSQNYWRYSPEFDANDILKDIWGTRAMIDCITGTAQEWVDDGHDAFGVGDISLYNGGNFPPHSSHKNGNGADIDSDRCCSINRASFNKEDSLALARALVRNGALRVLFNCKYVIDNCDEVKALSAHHHHMHVDVDAQSTNPHPEQECKHCKKSVYDACDYADKAERTNSELTA